MERGGASARPTVRRGVGARRHGAARRGAGPRANYRSRRGAKGRTREGEKSKNEFTTIRSFYRRARPSAAAAEQPSSSNRCGLCPCSECAGEILTSKTNRQGYADGYVRYDGSIGSDRCRGSSRCLVPARAYTATSCTRFLITPRRSQSPILRRSCLKFRQTPRSFGAACKHAVRRSRCPKPSRTVS